MSYVTKMNIRPAFVSRALDKFIEVNPLYRGVEKNMESWENGSKENDPELWSMLTDKDAPLQTDATHSDEEIEGIDINAEKEQRMQASGQPTLLENVDGPDLPNLANQDVNIASCEDLAN